MREYIGPRYLQFTDKQIQIANLILESLPDTLKRTRLGKLKQTPFRPTFDEVYNDDPSEAVRSNEIMDIARTSLNILTENMTGGTILNPLLNDIADNFNRDDEGKEVLMNIVAIEDSMIQLGIIPSDYVFLVANKKMNSTRILSKFRNKHRIAGSMRKLLKGLISA